MFHRREQCPVDFLLDVCRQRKPYLKIKDYGTYLEVNSKTNIFIHKHILIRLHFRTETKRSLHQSDQ